MIPRNVLYRLYPTGFIFLFFIFSVPAHSQVSGCKDPAATNYNPAATVSDSSCLYNTTFYTPPVKVDPISNVLIETSGLQMAGNFLWTLNDGGNAAAIYRIDTVSDAVLQTVNLEGATNVDWEDLTFDGTYFYVGDFGNNADGARTDLKIYKFPFSAIPDYTTDPVATIPSAQIEIINFTYSDQVPVAPSLPDNTKFDCEAMIVDGGKIHLFSKDWVDVITTHYVINGITAGTYVATPMETLATNYLVTAASKVPGLNEMVLLGYQASGAGNHYMHLLSDFSGGLYFNRNKRRIDLPNATVMGQAEGIAFRSGTYGYISNEKFVRTVGPFTLTVDQKLRSFNTESFVPAYVLPLNLIKFGVSPVNGTHQINWRFAAPVQHLRLLYSTNRTDFADLQTYPTSTVGTFFNQPATGASCYKLVWQEGNGAYQYSNTVCLNNEVKSGLRNIVLHANGELNFTFTSDGAAGYLFRLLTADGKVMAQTARRLINPGGNKVYFPQKLNTGHAIFLQAIDDHQKQITVLLKVED